MLKSVKIGNRTLKFPIIQGGMGVGISLSSLAGNVMKQDCMGVISAADPGFKKPEFYTDTVQANCAALKEEIIKAKEISEGKGILGVNIMVASNDYDLYVEQAVEAGAEAIISGAGLPLHLPKLISPENNVALAPIVSSGRALNVIMKTWLKKYNASPDFVVIESSKAGGHLGFKKENILSGTCESLDKILKDVLDVIASFSGHIQKNIPVFVAGGIFDGKDIAYYLQNGASGVQMATRFIATYECDADPKYKQAILDAKDEDIAIIQSPVGMPGRAVLNKFIIKSREARVKVERCFRCLKCCDPATTPYCITKALIEAAKGNVDDGVIFCGSNAGRIKKLVSVEELINELKNETNQAMGVIL